MFIPQNDILSAIVCKRQEPEKTARQLKWQSYYYVVLKRLGSFLDSVALSLTTGIDSPVAPRIARPGEAAE